MHEESKPSDSALALRQKQTNKYVTLALVAVLAFCGLMYLQLDSMRRDITNAQSTKQALAEITVDSDTCSVYPDIEQCAVARDVAADPEKVLTPKDGEKGADGKMGLTGPQGRGVAGFDQSSGNLIVTYTDGQTQNVGKVVGKDGQVGPVGPAGRGILSTNLQNGSLIVNYSDGTSENLGIIIGPAGEDGKNGLDGQAGTNGTNGINGADGISVTSVTLDATNQVIVTYSDGRQQVAGQLIINTIKFLQCDAASNVLTIGMVDGTTFSATVDCTPEAEQAPTAAPIPPSATPAPTTATLKQ